jgi:eukaryotic-like serine/threonine-protein kinase
MKAERWRKVDELLDAVLEREASERSAFLEQACEGDEELRREVESLLAAHLQAGSFIEEAPAEELTKLLDAEQFKSIVGQSLGRYQILSLLGTGGMGQVYRARDATLGREVAVKVLPSAFTQDAERVRRFEQEARAASSLNHPNIITIYEIGQAGRTHFIAAELVEGRTLRQRMADGRMKLSVALDVTAQVASALAAAHAAGIAHRDIKPENIMLRPDGLAKVLDFGLAKLVEPQAPPGGDPLTVEGGGTLPGVVMGTVGYMSPEQVRTEKVDARTDIFSLGVVLYEVLAVRQPFRGGSAVEVMNAILKEDPPELTAGDLEPRGSREQISPALERVVRRCLEKRPESRFQSASDLAFALKSLSDTSGAMVPSSAVAAAESERRRWQTSAVAIVAVTTFAVLFFVAGWLRDGFRQLPPSQPVRLLRLTDFAGLEEFPAVSPDGKSVAFTAEVLGKRQIWVRLLAGGPPFQITRDAGDHLYPRWSSDSASVIYYSPSSEAEGRGAIWEISMLGGAPRRLTSSIGSADLSRDGQRLAFIRSNEGQMELAVASRDGSDAHAVARLTPNFKYYSPRWSPDGEWIGYLRTLWFEDNLFVAPAKGGEPRLVVNDRNMLKGFAWANDSRSLVYSSSRGNTMLYLPSYNLWTVALAGGEPRQLTFGGSSYVQPEVHPAGAVLASQVQMQFNIWKYPVDGSPVENVLRAVQITHQTGQVQTPSVGPGDKEMVYLSDSGGHSNLWIMKLDSGETRQITFERDPVKPVGVPVWSPDGKHIAFVTRSTIQPDVDLWLISPDGSNLRKVAYGANATWSGDSRWLYYLVPKDALVDQLEKVSLEGGPQVDVRPDEASAPAVAPDGSAVFFLRYLTNVNDSPDLEVYVARPEDGPAHLLARIPGSRVPAWQMIHPVSSPDGKWLALTLTDGGVTNLWALPTAGGPLRQITDFGQRRTFIARRVSWSADGKSIFASLGEGDADVVLLDGLVP